MSYRIVWAGDASAEKGRVVGKSGRVFTCVEVFYDEDTNLSECWYEPGWREDGDA
jgi:hypothetical protein